MNELARTHDEAQKLESMVVHGDLSKLTAAERVTYYRQLCDAVGVSWFSKPFEYLLLNGKLVLYAKKDCTDQLRTKREISVTIVSKERIDDMFVVVARGKTSQGREDEDLGVVDVKGLVGERLANAMMKAMTKAKRRVTLSICGLGFSDESEVDGLPDARAIVVDPITGEIESGHDAGLEKVLQDTAAEFSKDIAEAATLPDLEAVASRIAEARKAGRVPTDMAKSMGTQYKAKAAQFAAAAKASTAS